VVTMEHCSKKGRSKILKACELPLTGKGVVDRIITELCVFDIDKVNGGMVLIEKRADLTVDDIRAKTEASFTVSPDLCDYRQAPK
jgi:acyl CoA:acetate/3-ketoacid CoA transferase beta subunit